MACCVQAAVTEIRVRNLNGEFVADVFAGNLRENQVDRSSLR
jgi:hypothetical protein